ncbi:MAG TPA: SLC13 family permease [Ohtaekwangia sp.]|nr:SLC13 family permease [Ohtaekwangia sp.]
MDFTLTNLFVLAVIVFLVYSLYKELLNPALTFFVCTVALLMGKVITADDLLKGLSNPQIIIIFLLVIVTAGIRMIFGTEMFARVFNPKLSAKGFLLRMMVIVSTISGFLNNTPIVAFMIPYVKEWAQKTGRPASKFLIPLSYATILGGMMTVIGTSTNLVLNGLIKEYGLTQLGFADFFYLGLIVTVVGWIYFYFIGYSLLPNNENKLEVLRENVKEYIIETEIFQGSSLTGKTVKDAGLRNLQDMFLVEIIRGDHVISPVSPSEVLAEGDLLFFSGNTSAIYNFIKDDNGLRIPRQDSLENEGHFNFVEAVVPANSELIGVRLKDSDFRKRFRSSVIAVHRNGKQVPGKVGETVLAGGDFLLLLASEERDNGSHEKDLYFLSTPKKITSRKAKWLRYLGVGAFAFLLLGITGNLPLFSVCVGIIIAFVIAGVLSLTEIRRELDLSLLMVLVCSLAIGVALEKSGTAALLADLIIDSAQALGPVGVITALFLVTILLTSLITNAAAVSIVFPIAMAIASQLGLPSTPFFVAIAFAASGDFMTPIGYQTNLMVYGPGGYTFRDFFKVGVLLTLFYIIICITFISYFYKLI